MAQNRILEAVERLKQLDRRGAAGLIRVELQAGAPTGTRWRSVNKLAHIIGETDSALEAARRLAATQPPDLERALHYCGELVQLGRPEQALAEAAALPDHPMVGYLRGTVHSQLGRFEQAESEFRRVLATTPDAVQTWFALAMIKTFRAGDPDVAALEALAPAMARAEPQVAAQYFYTLGKAYDDLGDHGRAFACYDRGAPLMRQAQSFDAAQDRRQAEELMRDYSAAALARLRPSGCDSERVIFVTGLPRSGTTLVEQILAGHSAVAGGAEVGLLQQALMPAGSGSLPDAMVFNERGGADPWGDVGRDYLDMMGQRFGAQGRLVDKTLNHSRQMGLLLHALPRARVIWLRRDPVDTALSCYRTFFDVPWAWSLADIAGYFRLEDGLYAHWAAMFPDRILTVPYEALAGAPQAWRRTILAHAGLAEEAAAPAKVRPVSTASMAQVRAPISAGRVRAADAYGDLMQPFRDAYRR